MKHKLAELSYGYFVTATALACVAFGIYTFLNYEHKHGAEEAS